MTHPFAIGATVSKGNGAPLVVLGYVETTLGGRMIACRADRYDTFDGGTLTYHLDPAKYTEVAADPLVAIAEKWYQSWITDYCYNSARRPVFEAILGALRDAS